MPEILIIGAGATGLALARKLTNQGQRPLVLESADHPGGPVRTVKTAGMQFECGPQALRSRPNTLRLIDDLSLRDRMIEATPAARSRFVLWDGKLRPVPSGMFDRSFMRRRDLLRAASEPFLPRREPPREESVYDFFTRRFGQNVAERLVDPFVAGIYAGDPHRVEAQAAFPDLVKYEASTGSVVLGGIVDALRERGKPKPKGPRDGFTIKGGLQALMETLAGSLPDGVVRLSCAVERVERKGKGFVVHAPGGPYEAERVVCTVPSWRASTILPDLGELAAIPSSPVLSVHLAFKASEAPGPSGFGWLAATAQRRDVLGVVWVSSVFPGFFPGRTVLRVMIGGAREDTTEMTEEQAVLRARKVVSEVEGIKADPVFTHVVRARMPQYEIGHTARLGRMREAMPGLDLLGWGYSGLGLEACFGAAAEWK